MDPLPKTVKPVPRIRTPWKAMLILAAGLAFGTWLLLTPSGLLGKADAAGYAVCHRIDARSFHIGERQMPLCARCSGMYLGALLGIAYLSRYGRRAGMPVLKVSIVLGLFLVLFAVDGANSYLHLFPGVEGIYEPSNVLRLATGTGIGLGIAAVLMPALHQTLWPMIDERPALSGWRSFLPLLGMAVVLDLAILSELPFVLYPLAVLSGISVIMVLSITFGVVWTLIAKRENRFQTYREAWPALTAGLLTAIIQIGLFDTVRFWLTGTWAGFNF